MASCASHKQTPIVTVYDADWEKMEQAFQRSKNAFFASDSADNIVNDLGWAKRLVTDAKIQEGTIPSVYKNKGATFTIELPCWEEDTDEYMSANVIAEHKRLDSALVKAKMQGVDDIFRRSKTNETYLRDSQGELRLDSIEYVDNYADYASKVKFSCLCITKEKHTYIVNATIKIERKNRMEKINDDEIMQLTFNE